MNLWKEYKSALSETISLYPESVWANWESKGMHLFAKTFNHPNLIKSREQKVSRGNELQKSVVTKI